MEAAERDKFITNLWCENGCPKKMTIHDKAGRFGNPGATIAVIEGRGDTLSPISDPLESTTYSGTKRQSIVGVGETLKHTCESCSAQFIPKRKTAKYCSYACRLRAHKKRTVQTRIEKNKALLCGE